VFLTASAANQAAAEYISTTAVSVWSSIVAAGRDVAGFAQEHFIWILGGLFLLWMAWRLLAPRR
jgi:hypothetical protein